MNHRWLTAVLVIASAALSLCSDDEYRLFAGGVFFAADSADAQPLLSLAQFDSLSSSWSNLLPYPLSLPTQPQTLSALAQPAPGGGDTVFMGGRFTFLTDGQAAFNVVAYSPSNASFTPPFASIGCAPTNTVLTAASAASANVLAFSGMFSALRSDAGTVLSLTGPVFVANLTAAQPVCLPLFAPAAYIGALALSADGATLYTLGAATPDTVHVDQATLWSVDVASDDWRQLDPPPPLANASSQCRAQLVYQSLAFVAGRLAVCIVADIDHPSLDGCPSNAVADWTHGVWLLDTDDHATWSYSLLAEPCLALAANARYLVAATASRVHATDTAAVNASWQLLVTYSQHDMAPGVNPRLSVSSQQLLVLLPQLVRANYTSSTGAQSSSSSPLAVYTFATDAWTVLTINVDAHFTQPLITASGTVVLAVSEQDTSTGRFTYQVVQLLAGQSSDWTAVLFGAWNSGTVSGMAVDGSLLLAGGVFDYPQQAGNWSGAIVSNALGWNITSQSLVDLGGGLTPQSIVISVALLPGTGVALVGGYVSTTDGGNGVAVSYDGSGWRRLPGLQLAEQANVETLLAYNSSVFIAGGRNFHTDSNASNALWYNLNSKRATDSALPPSVIVYALAVSPVTGWLYVAGSNGPEQQQVVCRSTDWLQADTPSWTTLLSFNYTGRQLRALAVAPDGLVYVGGTFTSLSPSLPMAYVAAMQDPGGDQPATQFFSLGEGVDGPVLSISVANTSQLLVSGQFAKAGGKPAAGLALWSPASWSWSLSFRADELSDPTGYIVSAAFVGYTLPPPVRHSHSRRWFIVGASAVTLLLLVGVVVLAALLVRLYRQRLAERHRYTELDQVFFDDVPDDGKPRLSVAALLADESIKKIAWRALDVDGASPLGVGGSGTVLAARWQRSGDSVVEVAIKRLHVEDSGIDSEEFLREIKLLSSLDHPNILAFYGVSIPSDGDGEVVALVVELMQRGSLDRLIRDEAARMSIGLKTQLLLDAAQGMAYLHACVPPIIHRDLKPQNILVDAAYTAKIADLGMSVFKARVARSMTAMVGTPVYMAPESLRGNDYNETVDVYSWACVACELLSGAEVYSQPEFRELPVHALIYRILNSGLRPVIPADEPALAALIAECFHQPDERPSFVEICSRLHRFARHLRSRAASPSSFRSAAAQQQRHEATSRKPDESTGLLAP